MTDLLERRVRVVARALARHGLVGAWGHCSARIDAESFLVCASKPMGTIVSEPGTVVPVAGPLPDGVLGEVRIHQQIYARRPDVKGVCRFFPPAATALSTQRITPRTRHGIGAFVDGTLLWEDVRLLRDDTRAAQLAELLADRSALVMRANGAVTAGESIEHAMGYAYCLEDAARVEQSVRALGVDPTSGLLTPEETASRQVKSGRVFERLWEHMTFGDPEAPPVTDAFPG